MTTKELFAKYTETKVTRKSKGAGKGYKSTVCTVWRDGFAMHNYITELEAADRAAYAIERCRVEYADMVCDRWWDCDSCRKSELKAYRSRITALRKEYGLSYDDIKPFMNVD